jgi:DNA-binding CsgD family transcriptional regulator
VRTKLGSRRQGRSGLPLSSVGGVDLVERDTQLADLVAAVGGAAAGRGSVVLVTGEAGAGKTALVRQFTSEAAARSKILWGLCDELVTPRPLGPFRDIAGQLGGDLAESSGPEMLESVVLALGGEPYPTVVVVEDAHWADEATVDAIRFVGRRVVRANALLVVTFRDDEVPADHPLRLAIGAIPPDDVRRVSLPPLSRGGIAELAGRADVDELHRLTGGNPFYVTELLAAPGTAVPPTVQDAVLARVGQLSAAGRECLETVAVVPGRAERWLLDACEVAGGVDDAVRLGVLVSEGNVVCFSHELARRAVERSLPTARLRAHNKRVLDALGDQEAEPARLAHHAVRAGDAPAVARYAPTAARLAASLNAHRQAVDHFEQALAYPDRFSEVELAKLTDDYASECYLTGRHDRALPALTQAIEIHRESGHNHRLGSDLRLLSDVHWFLGNGPEAGEAAAEAVAVLEKLPANDALVTAYAQRSKLAIVDLRSADAITWGDKAIDLARRLGNVSGLAIALITGGTARWLLGSEDDSSAVVGLRLAEANGDADVALAGYLYLANGHTNLMNYATAGRFIDEGLAFYEDNDVTTGSNMLVANRAWWHLEQGRWVEAERDAQAVLGTESMSRGRALRVLGQLQARRGDPTAETTLAEHRQLAERKEGLHIVLPSVLARVELAWLRGDLEAAGRIAEPLMDIAVLSGERRWKSEALFWLHRVGVLDEPLGDVLEPYASQMAGRWREAATAWAELGRPYEQADALGEASEPGPLLEALEILDQLGARQRAAMVRRRLVEMGVTSVPRGPRESTRTNPAGLTERQVEVLRLLADGLTYQEIAQRLHLSVKTVDHHAAAVRAKLDAATRAEAVDAGRRLGILDRG